MMVYFIWSESSMGHTFTFAFAGFKFPHGVAALSRSPLNNRLKEFKRDRKGYLSAPRVRGYFTTPSPDCDGTSFYLAHHGDDGGGVFDLRWRWADEVVPSRIKQRGWYCDSFQDETLRGLVFRLPGGRGFLAAYAMGVGMFGRMEYETFETEELAAMAADEAARYAAEEALYDEDRGYEC